MVKLLKKGILEIKNNWRKKEWYKYRLPSLIVRAIFHFLPLKNDGVFIMEEDWDNLIILDACRYDLFLETNWIEGKLEKKISRGSHTWMFMRENFKKVYLDTIYISANPFIWTKKDAFYKIFYVAPKEEIEKYGTVLPETVAAKAKEINKKYPHKRLIVHFDQPHYPFIGKVKIPNLPQKNYNPFYLLAEKKIEKETLWQAYKSNLERVLFVVEKLLKEFQGKTIITSDHGESFGDFAKPFPIRIWGHSGPRIKSLIEIPWLVIEKFPRKKIKKEERSEMTKMDEKEIRRHLKALGYF